MIIAAENLTRQDEFQNKICKEMLLKQFEYKEELKCSIFEALYKVQSLLKRTYSSLLGVQQSISYE
jgi:hypothetical protein